MVFGRQEWFVFTEAYKLPLKSWISCLLKQIWNLGSNPTKLLLCLIWREGLCLGWTACSLLSPFCVCSPNSITCFHDDKSSYNSKHPFNQQNSTSYYLQTYIAKFLVSDKQIKLAANKQIRYQNKMYFQQTAVSKTLFINSIYGLRFNYTYDNA